MKLTSLFAKFLYQNKQLNLPGIGVFTLDSSVAVPEPSDKNFQEFMQHIHYAQTPVLNPDEEFVEFIRKYTGKIKPLALSDLESFLSDGKLLLNIGKPFHIEGIGTLVKTREGNYEFVPGQPLLEKMEAIRVDDNVQSSSSKKNYFQKDYSQVKPESPVLRNALIVLGLVIAIAVVGWGGYSLYNRNTEDAQAPNAITESAESQKDTLTQQPIDSVSTQSVSTDSVNPGIQNTSSTTGTYKFIIETTSNKARALRRYNQLKSFMLDIRMETTDSTSFKLYFVIPALPADTVRIKDSLKRVYASRRIIVEQ